MKYLMVISLLFNTVFSGEITEQTILLEDKGINQIMNTFMIRELVKKIVLEKYSDAKTVFFAGSAAKNEHAVKSDIDFVVIYDHVPNAYRETFMYQGISVDVFVHDRETVEYFFQQIGKITFLVRLLTLIAEGIEVSGESVFGNELKQRAKNIISAPNVVSSNEIHFRRFNITNLLDDLVDSTNSIEQYSTAIELYKQLVELYLIHEKKWLSSGKHLIRRVAKIDTKISEEIFVSFQDFFVSGNWKKIERVTEKILEPVGGLLRDQFRNDFPSAYRMKV